MRWLSSVVLIETQLLDANDHRIGPDQRDNLRFPETSLFHPALAIGAGVVEPAGRLDQHFERSSSITASNAMNAPPSGSASQAFPTSMRF